MRSTSETAEKLNLFGPRSAERETRRPEPTSAARAHFRWHPHGPRYEIPAICRIYAGDGRSPPALLRMPLGGRPSRRQQRLGQLWAASLELAPKKIMAVDAFTAVGSTADGPDISREGERRIQRGEARPRVATATQSWDLSTAAAQPTPANHRLAVRI